MLIKMLLSKILKSTKEELKNELATELLLISQKSKTTKQANDFIDALKLFRQRYPNETYFEVLYLASKCIHSGFTHEYKIIEYEKILKLEDKCSFVTHFLADLHSREHLGFYNLEKKYEYHQKLSQKGHGYSTLVLTEKVKSKPLDDEGYQKIISLFDLSIEQGHADSYAFFADFLLDNNKISFVQYINLLEKGVNDNSACCCTILAKLIIDNKDLNRYDKSHVYSLIDKIEEIKKIDPGTKYYIDSEIDELLDWKAKESFKELMDGESIKPQPKKKQKNNRLKHSIKSQVIHPNKNKYIFLDGFYDSLSSTCTKIENKMHEMNDDEHYEGLEDEIHLRKNRYA